MKAPRINTWSGLALFATAALAMTSATGCQTSIGGQALPSAYFLTDDVQYFPAGPQDKLFNERRALEQYRAGQEAQIPGSEAPTPGAPLPENP
jgi:hypothetical protein